MFERLKSVSPKDYEQLTSYLKFFRQIEVPAKTILLNEGEIARKFYWIQSGCVRVCFNNSGVDITFQFFFENSAVASIESFRKGIPSSVSLETIEPSLLWYVNKVDAEQIFADVLEIPVLRELLIDSIFERTFDYMRHFLTFIKDTPTQRYLNLVSERPELIKRIPQHYIASHLGITRVHLSRIRNKIAKGNIL